MEPGVQKVHRIEKDRKENLIEQPPCDHQSDECVAAGTANPAKVAQSGAFRHQ